MEELSYLQQQDEDTILQHWYALGSLTVTSQTKLYRRGSIIRIDAPSPINDMHNRILYVAEDYTVDGIKNGVIKWSQVAVDDVAGMRIAAEGIQSPNFVVLNAKWSADFIADDDFIPFAESAGVTVNNGGVTISNESLDEILADVGFPFVTFQDVEFSKAEIQRVCIKPAMRRFFTFFPIVEEEAGGNYSRGSEFCVEFPENAYAVIPYYTVPGGTSASAASNNPFSYYNELQMTGAMGGGNKFGRGLHYYGKMTPGYVGMEWRNGQLDRLAQSQAFLNYFRREKVKRVKIDGKWYAQGFSTIGGNLNFKWLKVSYDWDDIPMDLVEPVAKPMAKANVLNQFAMLRSLVKTDIAGALDPTVLANKSKELEETLKPILESVAVSSSKVILRGGG